MLHQVLDLTHDQNAPFCVEFDDQRWRLHLARIKPLGLAALLNTCAPAPRHTYAHFCAHLTCEAQLRYLRLTNTYIPFTLDPRRGRRGVLDITPRRPRFTKMT
jgi:hypothetical protein